MSGQSGASRFLVVVVMIVALIGAGLTRNWADLVRGEPIVASSATGSLSGMNSYALALLLGGLRGPLVMFLWTSSEEQKTENDLQDFDSKVEWIRLLQPEFDTVHLFEIWNKAYNISVKMTTRANKYATILDALDYAHKVDLEKPNDINILSAIGGIYFDKLGSASEKAYYRQQVRNQTLPHRENLRIRHDDPAARRTQLDPMLDEHFNILPDLYTPRGVRISDPSNPAIFYDGSDLQFLPQFNPYPYGISPQALAYNYLKRAQLLQLIGNQRHAQLSDLVIDSRPALAIRGWADEEWEYGRRAELEAFGKPAAPGADRLDFEFTAADFPLNSPIVDRAKFDEAVFEYGRAAMLCGVADKEFADHIDRYKESESTYASHRLTVQAEQQLCQADHNYLAAMVTSPAQRPALLASAAKEYTRSLTLYRLVILRYYVYDEIAAKIFPKGVTRQNITDQIPDLGALTDKAITVMEQVRTKAAFEEDAGDYLKYMERTKTRLKLLAAQPTTAPTSSNGE